MNDADLTILQEAIKLVESKVYRDYFEIGNLQSTSKCIEFLRKTIEYLNYKLFDFLSEKRYKYSINIKGYKDDIKPGSKRTIYVNPISGMKNFMHGIPYFATVLSIKEDNEVVCGLINNYATNEMFFVAKGRSAFVNNKKLRVSNRNIDDNSIIAIEYVKNIDYRYDFHTIKINNCSILDACYTACGKYDASIVINGNNEEMKLAELLIRESGGLSHKFENGSMILSNSIIFSSIKKQFEG